MTTPRHGSREDVAFRMGGLEDGPISRKFGGMLSSLIHKNGAAREPYVYDRDVTAFQMTIGWAISTENGFMEILNELKTDYDQAAELWAKYEDRLNKFRSMVKNDVTSLEAAARKTSEAANKMMAAYGQVLGQLNGQEMESAIRNAERLAEALRVINSLQGERVSLSIDTRVGG